MEEKDLKEQIMEWLDKPLNLSSCFKSVDINVLFKNDACAIICDFFTSKYREKAILKTSVDKITQELIIDWANKLIKELTVIDKLNEKLEKAYTENNYYALITYRWSNCEYCEISEWDYDELVIKLSRDAIEAICAYESELDDLIADANFDTDNILEYIKEFNDDKFNNTIRAQLDDNETIFNKLTTHMLNFNDLKNLAKQDNKGIQNLKIVIAFRDLGLIGVFFCKIDYKNQTCDINISENKLIDTDRERFVRNNSLCEGLCEVIKDKIKQNLMWI